MAGIAPTSTAASDLAGPRAEPEQSRSRAEMQLTLWAVIACQMHFACSVAKSIPLAVFTGLGNGKQEYGLLLAGLF